jgi:protein-S-isoprenylcysteine O-methyltransferase Ste14
VRDAGRLESPLGATISRMRHVVYDAAESVVLCWWGAIAIMWLRLAPHVPAGGARPTGNGLSRLAGLLAIGAVLSPATLWQPLQTDSPLVRAIGTMLLFPAGAFAIWARVRLGEMWSSSVAAARSHRLVTHGPYAVTRHPIYTGVLAMLGASAMAEGLGRWLAIGGCASAVLIVKTHQEEQVLAHLFMGAYGEYRARVPRLLPRLRRRPTQRSRLACRCGRASHRG